MIRWLLRLAVLPLVIVLQLLVWIGACIAHYSGILCRIFSSIVFALVVIGFVTGLGSKEHLIEMLAVGFCFFIMPMLGATIVGGIALAHGMLAKYIEN